ncbi:MAG: NAD(P)-dependent oxidoreductase, partial [Lactobacillaceae bacterium]
AKSDIVSIHVPYFPGQNDRLIDADFLKKMKPTAVLVNTARTQLADYSAIIKAITQNQISGFASDVLPDEAEVLGHDFKGNITNELTKQLIDLYPKVLLTPHIGSYTSPALTDMIAVSYENFHQVLETGKTDNDVKVD